MRWRITLEYDGTDFNGWQRQDRGRTVQEVVERAIAKLVLHEVVLTASGRTDAGVHARGQVASFETTSSRTAHEMRVGLTHFLPEDVAIVTAEPVSDAFDPRHWAWAKHYRYTIVDRPARSPLRRRQAWHLRGVDANRMAAGVVHLVGRHDFSAFRHAACNARTPERVLDAASVTRDGDEIRIDVHGQGFLRHMVRIIAGTLVDVGVGKREPEWVADVLSGRDRTRGGRTAPACGLCLMSVRYEDAPPPWVYKGEPPEDEE